MDGQATSDWESEIQRHRDELLRRLLLALVILGLGALPVFLLLQPEIVGTLGWITVVVLSVAWLITLVAWLWRGMGYRLRALSLIAVAYAVNVTIFMDNGRLDSVDAWMLLPLAVGFALLGSRAGIFVGAGGLALFTSFAFVVSQGLIPVEVAKDPAAPAQLAVQGMGHLLSVVVLALVLSSANRGWLEALKGASVANKRLEDALGDLRTLNEQLDQRVIERTRELAEALARDEAVLNSIADGVIVFDNRGRATVANPAIAGLLEHPAEEIVGRDFGSVMGDGVSAADREIMVEILADRETRYPAITLEWGEKTLSASVAPVQVQSGEVVGKVAVLRDFTREAEIDRMRKAFVSIASHELRTPLAAILGYAALLMEEMYGPLVERQRHLVERVVSNARHMLGLTNDLLDEAMIESGALTLSPTPFCPAELVSEVLEAMEVLAAAKGLALTGEVGEGVPATLVGDRARLHQILTNLVGNAVKFTEQGRVEVRAYTPDEDHWALEVRDTGPGISAEAQGYIFEPFRRAHLPKPGQRRGAGLGLSIVRQLAEMMGGKVLLRSEVGCGSTFTVVLPLVMGQQEGDGAAGS